MVVEDILRSVLVLLISSQCGGRVDASGCSVRAKPAGVDRPEALAPSVPSKASSPVRLLL